MLNSNIWSNKHTDTIRERFDMKDAQTLQQKRKIKTLRWNGEPRNGLNYWFSFFVAIQWSILMSILMHLFRLHEVQLKPSSNFNKYWRFISFSISISHPQFRNGKRFMQSAARSKFSFIIEKNCLCFHIRTNASWRSVENS